MVKEGKAEARPVTVGDWNGDEWFVFEGLKAGERVVTDGGLLLNPGMPVTIRQASAAPGPATGAARTVVTSIVDEFRLVPAVLCARTR